MAALFPVSLRGKIMVGFSLLAATVVLSLLITFIETSLIEEQLDAQKQSHVLLNAIYEIRRQEKNYLLYHQAGDLRLLVSSVRDLNEALQRSVSHYILSDDVETMERLAAGYAGLVTQLSSYAPGNESGALQTALREKGSQMIESAKALTGRIEDHIATKFRRLKVWLLASKFVLAGLAVAAAFAVSTVVIRSLKEFKSKMDGIVRGTWCQLPQTARDEEIASLEQACNRMLQEISLRQAHLVQSEKLASMGTMLAGMAHELNNPLSNISSSCQILLEELRMSGSSAGRTLPLHPAGRVHHIQVRSGGAPVTGRDGHPDDALVREMLLQIHGETERAREIVQTLLDYSRTRPSQKDMFALLPLIRETLTLFHGRLGKNIAVGVDIPEGLQAYGDRHRVQQVFVNLFRNALDALGTGGTMTIAAAGDTSEHSDVEGRTWILRPVPHRPDSLYVEVSVSDTGKGIPPAEVTRIFDPFFTTKDVGHGTGLGLYIVREIMEEHCGGIAIRSEEGRGTTFTLYLPASGD